MQIGFSCWLKEQHKKMKLATKEKLNQKSNSETWQKRILCGLKPERGISGGSDCKDSESCIKSGFRRIYLFGISPKVLQCIFSQLSGLSEAERGWYANPMQCSNVLFSECQEINSCIARSIQITWLGTSNFYVQHICLKDLVCREN